MAKERKKRSGYGIKACKNCGHGIAIHHGNAVGHLTSPCNYPGCKCKNYKSEKD